MINIFNVLVLFSLEPGSLGNAIIGSFELSCFVVLDCRSFELKTLNFANILLLEVAGRSKIEFP